MARLFLLQCLGNFLILLYHIVVTQPFFDLSVILKILLLSLLEFAESFLPYPVVALKYFSDFAFLSFF
jgi:hypothetical protein